jgi:hypothetical protein
MKGETPFEEGERVFDRRDSPLKRVNKFTLKGESPFYRVNEKGESNKDERRVNHPSEG